MRRLTALFLSSALTWLLCSCGAGGVPLGEKAIVKAVFLDSAGGKMQASLVVFTCAPSANTADVTEEARIYTGSGATAAAALQAAEESGGRQAFYAQNRLLLLGRGAAANAASACLSCFDAENAGRGSLCIFATQLDSSGLQKLAKSAAAFVRDAERLCDAPRTGAALPLRMEEVRFGADGSFSGCIPLLEVRQTEPLQLDTARLLLYRGGRPVQQLEGLSLQTAQLLLQKQRVLAFGMELGGRWYAFETQPLHVERSRTPAGMEVKLCGSLRTVACEGAALHGATAAAPARAAQQALLAAAQALYRSSLSDGCDLFAERPRLAALGMPENGALLRVRCTLRAP